VESDGRPLWRIDSCAGKHITNCALTPDGAALVMTESATGSILIAELPAR
jgi:hypothetical protein